ncbi:MAG: hypothetical protein DRI80_06595 [Chloroflexota bacterium]|nr:MAG: hypothetical protein DRI80_06595 [Chloroflexota bacterium]
MTIHAKAFTVSLTWLRILPTRTRYPLPGDLMHFLISGAITVIEAVRQWAVRTDSVDEHLAGIRQLADSIATVGLIHPITITGDGTLVSGLRRVLAQALLVVQGHSEFSTIRAVVADSVWSLAQQMAETLVREDLTAVETAINLGLLIAEIEDAQIEVNQPLFDSDGMITVPIALRKHLLKRRAYGTWEKITATLGKTYRHWTNYVRILRLCDPALTLAHQAGLTEWALRGVVGENLDCDGQLRRIREMVEGKPPEESEENEKAEAVSPSAIKSVEKILAACDHLASFNPDSLRRAVTRVFSGLVPEDLEDSYEVFEVIYNTLRALRDWHVGESRESEAYR